MTSKETNLLSKRLEQDALADSLARFSQDYRNTVSWGDMPVRSAETDTDHLKEVQAAQTVDDATKVCSSIAAAMRSAHEADRDMRDFEIIKCGRKKLMLSCIRAAKFRYDKLSREIEALEKSPA